MLKILGGVVAFILLIGPAAAQRDCEILGNCNLGRGTATGVDKFAAIAYSPGDGQFGYSYAHPTQTSAESAAMQACQQRGRQCRIVVWGVNTCIGVATGSGGGMGEGWGPTHRVAMNNAIGSCATVNANCTYLTSSCASGRQTGWDDY